MPPALTLASIEGNRLSPSLPLGCSAHPLGLVLRKGLTPDELGFICQGFSKFDRAVAWWIGDLLAYGNGSEATKRVSAGLYKTISEQTGRDEQSLRNMKCVCASIPLSLRGDKLTMGAATVIVGAFRDHPEQYAFWIQKVASENLSISKLRELIRKSEATHRPEANDVGDKSLVEICRQFDRDFLAATGGKPLSAKLRKGLLETLRPVLNELK